jgi:teichoic acid transport system permease protein
MSRNIFSQIATVSKSNFPISTLPIVALYSNFLVFAALNIFLLLITIIYKVPITMYWIQIIYYAVGMIYFLFAVGNQRIKVVGLILENDPIYYLINGYRESILSTGWFYQKPTHALFFWSFSTIIFIVGICVHLKFRSDLSIYS